MYEEGEMAIGCKSGRPKLPVWVLLFPTGFVLSLIKVVLSGEPPFFKVYKLNMSENVFLRLVERLQNL